MHVYIIMLLISLLFIYLSEKNRKKSLKIIFYIAAAIPFILVSALRYDVGTDYFYRYVPNYNQMAKGLDVPNLEIGFKLLINLCLIFTKDYQILFAITSIITISLFMYAIYKNSKNKLLSVAIFFLGGFFFQSLNILRQYMAIGIIFFSYRYLLNKKYWIFLIGVVLAFFIHSTSIICLIFFLLKDREIFGLRNIIIFSLVILILGTPIINIIENALSNTRFNVYFENKYNIGDVKILTLLSSCFLYLFMYALYIVKKKNDKLTKEDIFYINVEGLTLIFIILSSKFFLFFRIAYYSMIYLIISLPYFIYTTDKEDIFNFYIEIIKKFIKKDIHVNNKIKENFTKLLFTFIIIFFITTISYTNIFHNDEEVLPYKTIFERENYK